MFPLNNRYETSDVNALFHPVSKQGTLLSHYSISLP